MLPPATAPDGAEDPLAVPPELPTPANMQEMRHVLQGKTAISQIPHAFKNSFVKRRLLSDATSRSARDGAKIPIQTFGYYQYETSLDECMLPA